ncbi:16S rRNA (cytosine(1402)-N(4))-methyltransferase RsmH [Patescibacteria group bacterium]
MHKSVLLNETIEFLDIQPNDIVLDGTLGGGGHSKEICARLSGEGMLIGLDQDIKAVARVEHVLEGTQCKRKLVQGNFRNLSEVLDILEVKQVDKVLFDLGFSSFQIEASGRGFSFQKNEPLLMTYSDTVEKDQLTAYELVNTWDEENIADVIYGFGDERYSRRIARGIVEARTEKPIKSTFELVEIIKEAVPGRYRNGKIHPATKTFQAIRIAVNDEFGALEQGIESAIERLAQGGRLAIITFHSTEDRIVKRAFRDKKEEGLVTILTKKPIAVSREEIEDNPRARSAKLRVIQKN